LLKEIAETSGINICFGFTLKEDLFNSTSLNIDIQNLHNEIRYELIYGYDDLIPAFLGEVLISENFPNPLEETYFQIVFKVMEEFKIPVFIKLNTSFPKNLSIIEYILKHCHNHKIEKKLFVFIYTKVYYLN
jgi:hypothetical protein